MDEDKKKEEDWICICISCEMCIGVTFGVIFNNIGLFISFGTFIGLLVGYIINSKKNR